MEEALVAWANNWLRHIGVLTYNLLLACEQEIGEALGISDF